MVLDSLKTASLSIFVKKDGELTMWKVCHVTSAHSRYDPRIFLKQCSSLAHAGYDVSLIVNDELDDEICNGVTIVSTGYKPRNRVDRYFGSRKALLNLIGKINADVYHLHDPELMPLATTIKRQYGKIVIFDFHENTERQIRDKKWIPLPFRTLIANVYAMYERYATKRYDALIGVTPAIVDKLLEVNGNVVMITNYPITESTMESGS